MEKVTTEAGKNLVLVIEGDGVIKLFMAFMHYNHTKVAYPFEFMFMAENWFKAIGINVKVIPNPNLSSIDKFIVQGLIHFHHMLKIFN